MKMDNDAKQLKQAAMDISLFLRLARSRFMSAPNGSPNVVAVIERLMRLADDYGEGKDISK